MIIHFLLTESPFLHRYESWHSAYSACVSDLHPNYPKRIEMSETTTEGQNNGTDYFSQPDKCRQLGLEVEDQIFWVSKESLSAYSPVFMAMLYGEFEEAGKNVIPLPNKKAKDVLELLHCLFPTPMMRKIDHSNVGLLLAFADEYQVPDLTSRCSDFFDVQLLKLPDRDKKLLDILKLASKHRLHSVLFSVVERCSKCFGMEKLQNSFDQWSSEIIGAITWMKLALKQEALLKLSDYCPKCNASIEDVIHVQRCCSNLWSYLEMSEECRLWRRGIEDLLKRV